MTAPRHLWSGDWEEDSAAHADELARRRREHAERPAEPEPEPPPPVLPHGVAAVPRPPAAAHPTWGQQLARLLGALGGALLFVLRALGKLLGGISRRLRAVVASLRRADRARLRAAAILALAVAVVAIAAVAILGSGGSPSQASAASPAAVRAISRWLGVQFATLPGGSVVIETVNPSGAAASAELEPGDVVSQIDSQPIANLGDVQKAFDAINPGDQVLIAINRGSTFFSTSFPMPPRPARGP